MRRTKIKSFDDNVDKVLLKLGMSSILILGLKIINQF